VSMRVEHHPILGDMKKRNQITIHFNGQPFQVYEGDTIASALMAEGVKTLRYHEVSGKARGIYCNIGHCFECRVRVNDRNVVRSCLTPVVDGMVINSISGLSLEDDQHC